MLSSGKISFEDVKKMLASFSAEGGKFENLMQRQSTSFLGMLSTLKDTINITLAAVGEGIRPIATKLMGAFLPMLEVMRAFAVSTGPLAGNIVAMTTAVIGLTTSIMSARLAMQMMGLTFRQVLIGTGWGIALIALGVALGVIISGIQKLYAWLMSLKPVQEAMAVATAKLTAAWGVLKDALFTVWESMKMVFASIVDAIENTLGVKFASLPATVMDAFIWIVQVITDFVSDMAAWTVVILENWQTVWEMMKIYTWLIVTGKQIGRAHV